MFTLNDLNTICGSAWDEDYSTKIDFIFLEEASGLSKQLLICSGKWAVTVEVTPFVTTHLPRTMSFKRSELHVVFRKLRFGYKDVFAKLPLEFTPEGFEVKHGPAKGSRVGVCK